MPPRPAKLKDVPLNFLLTCSKSDLDSYQLRPNSKSKWEIDRCSVPPLFFLRVFFLMILSLL